MRLPVVSFGRTGLRVSRLCLGTGSSGNGGESVQGQGDPEEYARVLIRAAQDFGLTFWDTAFLYGTHKHVRYALDAYRGNDIVLASKSCTRTARIEEEVHIACDEMGVEQIGVFIMHQVDSIPEWEESREALEALMRSKKDARIRAVGLSTHNIDVLEEVAGNSCIDVIFTNYNFANVHMDADITDYTKALQTAYDAGQGVYVHKTLGAGKLVEHYDKAIHFNLDQAFIHSVSVGITSMLELEQLMDCYARW